MKPIICILLAAFSANLYAQKIAIEFQSYQKPYQSLINGVDLTNSFTEQDWEIYNLSFELNENIFLMANEATYEFSTLNISFDSYIWLDGQNISTGEVASFDLFPLGDILTYRYLGPGDPDNSSIVYLFQEDTSFIEFKNLTFYYNKLNELSPESNFNLIISIDHNTGSATFHYGESEYTPGIFNEYLNDTLNARILVGLGIIEDWRQGYPVFLLQNSPADPDTSLFWVTPYFDSSELTGLSDLPVEGTVYSFEILPASRLDNQKNDQNVNVYPNPGHSFTQVKTTSKNLSSISVINFTGKIVYQNTFTEYHDVNTAEWLPGLYVFKLANKDGTKSLRWIKY